MNLSEHNRDTRKAQGMARVMVDRYAPFAIKQAIAEQNYDAALRELSSAIDTGAPWAIRCWLECVGAVGSTQQVIINLNAQLGVRDESELRELVEAGRKVRESHNDVSKAASDLIDDGLALAELAARKVPLTVEQGSRADRLPREGRTLAQDAPHVNGDG